MLKERSKCGVWQQATRLWIRFLFEGIHYFNFLGLVTRQSAWTYLEIFYLIYLGNFFISKISGMGTRLFWYGYRPSGSPTLMTKRGVEFWHSTSNVSKIAAIWRIQFKAIILYIIVIVVGWNSHKRHTCRKFFRPGSTNCVVGFR